MRRREKMRATASLICIMVIMIIGLSGVFIYKNVSKSKALQENSAVSDEELDAFYSGETAAEDDSDASLYENLTKPTKFDFTFPGRTLTREVVPYDGAKRNIACWGDSMTEGIGASYAVLELDGESHDISYWTFPDALEYFTGIKTYNFGVSGENSEEISIRAGGIKLYTDRDVVVGYNHGADVKVVNEKGEPEYVQNYGGYGNLYDDYYGVVYINGQMYTLGGASFDDEEQAYNIVDLRLTRYGDNENVSYYTYYEEKTEEESEAQETTESSAGTADTDTTWAFETRAFLPTQSSNDIRDDRAKQGMIGSYEEETTVSHEDELNASDVMAEYGIGYNEEFEYDGDTYIVIPAGTLVTPKAAADHSNDILIIEMGSNGGWHGEYSELIAQYDSIIERFGNPYYIIIGDTDDPGDSADANQGLRDSEGNKIGLNDTYWETALREAYGEHFLNTREYMITNGLRDTGLLTTKRDLRYFQNGMISKKLRADWTHFNSYGYYSKAKAIYLKGAQLGYWD